MNLENLRSQLEKRFEKTEANKALALWRTGYWKKPALYGGIIAGLTLGCIFYLFRLFGQIWPVPDCGLSCFGLSDSGAPCCLAGWGLWWRCAAIMFVIAGASFVGSSTQSIEGRTIISGLQAALVIIGVAGWTAIYGALPLSMIALLSAAIFVSSFVGYRLSYIVH